MHYKDFTKGLKITCGYDTGVVNFIDKMYITLTTHRWKKPPELAAHSINNYNEVNVLVYKNDWCNCVPVDNTEEKQISVTMYKSQEGRYEDVQ